MADLLEKGYGSLIDSATGKPKPEADVIDIETKKKVDEKGLGSLRDDFGLPEGVDPKSERGKLIKELQRVTAGSKEADKIAIKQSCLYYSLIKDCTHD